MVGFVTFRLTRARSRRNVDVGRGAGVGEFCVIFHWCLLENFAKNITQDQVLQVMVLFLLDGAGFAASAEHTLRHMGRNLIRARIVRTRTRSFASGDALLVLAWHLLVHAVGGGFLLCVHLESCEVRVNR